MSKIITLLVALTGSATFWAIAPPMVMLPGPVEDGAGVIWTRILLVTLAAGAWFLGWMVAKDWKSRRKGVRTRRRIYAGLMALALVLTCWVGIVYTSSRDVYVVRYQTLDIIKGSELTAAGAKFFEKRPTAGDANALMSFTGNYEEVWTRESISSAKIRMWLQCVAVLFAAVFLITAIGQIAGAALGKIEEPEEP